MTSDTSRISSKKIKNENKFDHLYSNGIIPASLSSWNIVMALVISIRIICANMAPIMDCDEVYNYWEPLHFMQFQTGMQTWEYAPQYALRTYAYLLPLSLLSQILYRIFNLFSGIFGIYLSKPLLFQCLRSMIAAFTAYTEVKFVQSLSFFFDETDDDEKTPKHPNPNLVNSNEPPIRSLVPFWTLLTSVFSAGMFHSSPALLPSVTVMQFFMLSYSYYLRKMEITAVVLGLVAVLATGWPFCALLWIPMGLKILWDGLLNSTNASDNERSPVAINPKQVMRIIGRTVQHALLIQLVVSTIDYYYYGEVVFPTFNILEYNAASGGDELYGVEDVFFYGRNLLLNWNGALVLAFLSLLPNVSWNKMTSSRILFGPMILWIFFVFPRPHKEERFLYPIYPLLSFGCALTLDTILLLLVPALIPLPRNQIDSIASFNRWIQRWSGRIGTAILFGIGAISFLRSKALSHYYTAPLSLYQHLHDTLDLQEMKDRHVKVCIGGEWHRFTSSFYLPSAKTTLEFLPSRFKGQLPAPFTSSSLSIPFNDQNMEEPSRYIEGGISSCNFLVELMLEGREEEPEGLEHMNKHKKERKYWVEDFSVPFLDSEQTGMLDRVLYLPWRKDGSRVFAKYSLFRRRE